jgi:succinate-semialdehyde dehydrogenase/glutarate-semialdehyde dehydrogenase
MTRFQSIHPYTLEILEQHPLMNNKEVSQCINLSEQAFSHWRHRSFAERAAVLERVADVLMKEQATLANLISLEMGKVLPEAMAEIEKSAWVCRYYAEHAEAMLADTPREAGLPLSFVSYEPTGAILGIMPWNFPFWQVFRYAAPALMAGNVTLLKHAPNVCGCSKKIEAVFREAGAPAGVFQSLIIETSQAEQVIQARVVQGVTLTGSNRAGSAVAALAGKYTKKTVLELGGSDALVVLADADLKAAAATALQSRMLNAGQTCISAKRFIVVQEAADDFIQEIQNGMQLLKQGNPFESGITTGPMARPDLAASLQRQLEQSVQKGAHLLLGGVFDQCNVSPLMLLNVQPGMPAFDEETFGPLACISIAAHEADAVALANHSAYGLAASLWSCDLEKATAIARQLECGSVFINSMVKSDPRLPFGGIKASGYGRELGKEGLMEFVNVKTIAG